MFTASFSLIIHISGWPEHINVLYGFSPKEKNIYLFKYIANGIGVGDNTNDRPYVILAMLFNFILSSSHLYFWKTPCFYGNAWF